MNASATSLPERVARVDQRLASSASSAIGFSHKHVLAGRERAQRPRHMQLVGQADCRSPRSRDRRAAPRRSHKRLAMPSCSGRALRLGEIARGDRVDVRDLALLHRRDDFFGRDLGDADHAPLDLAAHSLPPLAIAARSAGSGIVYAFATGVGSAAVGPARSSIQPGYSGVQRARLVECRDLFGAQRQLRPRRDCRRAARSVLAPMMTLITPLRCSSQASATRATETPCALAIGAMASMMS